MTKSHPNPRWVVAAAGGDGGGGGDRWRRWSAEARAWGRPRRGARSVRGGAWSHDTYPSTAAVDPVSISSSFARPARAPPRGPRRLRGLPRAAPASCSSPRRRTHPASHACCSPCPRSGLQPGLLLLEKLPEHFYGGGGGLFDELPLPDDAARLIVVQFRWLDFLVDANVFIEKLVQVLSVACKEEKAREVESLQHIRAKTEK
ncbi:hypothetical protein ACP4OV_011053 [Aristida adscensionis]